MATAIHFTFFYQQTVTLIEGDGIGPEISGAVIRIFEAAQVGDTNRFELMKTVTSTV